MQETLSEAGADASFWARWATLCGSCEIEAEGESEGWPGVSGEKASLPMDQL